METNGITATPAEARREGTEERGESGIVLYVGRTGDRREYNPDWTTPATRFGLIEKMTRGNGTVAAMALATIGPITRTTWGVGAPEDASDKEQEAAEFIEAQLFGRRHDPWSSFVWRAMGALTHGVSLHEIVLAQDAGRIVLDRLAVREQFTIREFTLDEAGRVAEVSQWPQDTRRKTPITPMPGWKLVHFPWGHGADPWGESALRACYPDWYSIDRMDRYEVIAAERFAVPALHVTYPRAGNQKELRARALEIGDTYKAHEGLTLATPDDWKVEVLSSGSDKMLDVTTAVQRREQRMARVLLAQWLLLAQQGTTGNRALGQSFTEQAALVLECAAEQFVAVVEQQLIARLVAWNFGDAVRVPELRYAPFAAKDLGGLAATYKTLVEAGGLRPSDEDEQYWREQQGLPAAPEGAVEREMHDRAVRRVRKLSEHQVHAATAARSVWKPWRELRASERVFPFGEVAGRQDDAVAAIVRSTDAARAQIVSGLVRDAVAAVGSGDPASAAKIEADAGQVRALAAAILGELREVAKFGAGVTKRVLARGAAAVEHPPVPSVAAHMADPLKPASAPENIRRQLRARALIAADRAVEPVVAAARAAAAQEMRAGGVIAHVSAGFEDDLETALTQRSLRDAAAVAGTIVSEAFNLGASGEAEKRAAAGEQLLADYTALLDDSTCPQCRAADANAANLDVPSAEYYDVLPPLHSDQYGDCDGWDRCRCTLVFKTAGEEV